MSESYEAIPEPKLRILNNDEWRIHRDIRLRAAEESPRAFGSTLEDLKERSEEGWRAWLQDSKVYIIESGDVPVAAITFRKDIDDVWVVNGVWTDPNFRNRGLSKKLFERVFTDARAQGIISIQLGVNPAQETALQMYESLGFSELKREKNQRWGDGSISDNVVMEKKL